MKVRIGFVSNSSSSSYVVRGIKISVDNLAQFLGVFDKLEEFRVPNANNDNVELNEEFFKEYGYLSDFFGKALAKKIPKNSKLDVWTMANTGDYEPDENEENHPMIVGYEIGEICQDAFDEVPEMTKEHNDLLIEELKSLGIKFKKTDIKTYAKFSPGF